MACCPIRSGHPAVGLLSKGCPGKKRGRAGKTGHAHWVALTGPWQHLVSDCLPWFLSRILLVILGSAPVMGLADGVLAPITEKLRTGQALTFATFGDSITWPCFHTDYRQNYMTFAVDALRQAYPQANIRIVHAGNMGTARRGLSKTRFERYVLAHQPDLVFIMFGMNDCGAGEKGLGDFADNLVQLVNKTRDTGAIPVICTQNEIISDSPSGRGRKSLPLYMARALEVARREQVSAVDCFADWAALKVDRQLLATRLNDSIHPNHAGHRLMAYTILKKLWPGATRYLSTGVATPEPHEKQVVRQGLLPGPSGKQVLRTSAGLWCAVSAGYQGQHGRDLVFSWTDRERPRWDEFQHVTLIGSPQTAVFDHLDRPLTSGMLLEHGGRIYVLFGWKVGIFMLTIDPALLKAEQAPENKSRLTSPATWLEHTNQLFVRPSSIRNASYRPGGILFDAYGRPGVWPYVLCRFLKKSADTGGEVVKGEDTIVLATRDHGPNTDELELLAVSPGFMRVTKASDGHHYYVTQEQTGDGLRVGRIGVHSSQNVAQAVERVIVPACGKKPLAVIRAVADVPGSPPRWMRLCWGMQDSPELTRLEPADGLGDAVPLPWSDGETDGITWHPMAQQFGGQVPFGYSSRLAVGERCLGLLREDQGKLVFEVVPCVEPGT